MNNTDFLSASNIEMVRISPDCKSIIIDFLDGNCSIAKNVHDINVTFRADYLKYKDFYATSEIAKKILNEIKGTNYDGIATDENWFVNGFNKRCADNDSLNRRLKLPELNFTGKVQVKQFQHIAHGLDRILFNNFVVTYNLQFLLKESYKAVDTYYFGKDDTLHIKSIDWIVNAIKAQNGSAFNFASVKKSLLRHNNLVDVYIALQIVYKQIYDCSKSINEAEMKSSEARVNTMLEWLNGNPDAEMPNEAVLEPTTTVVSENSINTLLDIKRVSEDENTVTTEMNGNKFIIDKKVNDCSTEFSIRSINGKSNDDVVSDHSDNFNDDDMFAIEMAIRESAGTLTDEFQDAIVCKEYESLRYDEHKWYPRRNVEREPMRQTVVPERYDAEKWSVNPNIAKVDRNNDYIDYKSEPLNCETVDPAVPNSNDNVDLIFTAVPGKHTVENDYSEFTDPINIELQQYREAHSEEFEPYVWQHDTVTVTKSKNKTRKTRK